MVANYLQLLTRRDTLLSVGVCLVIVGVVLRGIARSGSRDQALRRQHKLDNPSSPDDRDATDRHLEKYLPRYATACITAGLILFVAAFFR